MFGNVQSPEAGKALRYSLENSLKRYGLSTKKRFNIFDFPTNHPFFEIIKNNYWHEEEHPNYWISQYNWRGDPSKKRLGRGRPEQIPPWNKYNIILYKAGRGTGKTRMGAEWIRSKVETHAAKGEQIIVSVIGQTAADNRNTLIHGPSGLISVSPPWFEPWYVVSEATMYWPNGSKAIFYSGDKPEQQRGGNPMYAWIDEACKFQYFDDLFYNLRLSLRQPSTAFPDLINQILITTTPKPLRWIKQMIKDAEVTEKRPNPKVLLIEGSTYDNEKNLTASFISDVRETFEGTSLGRQEVYGDILSEDKNALFTTEMILRNILPEAPKMEYKAVAIDPPGRFNSKLHQGTECGILVGGIADKNMGGETHYYIVADRSLAGKPPEWARQTLNAYYGYHCDKLVAEVNFGGDMIETALIEMVPKNKPHFNYQEVVASKSKQARAEPIVMLFEQNRVHLIGDYEYWELLISEMVTWVPGDKRNSPNRLDALVWLITHLSEISGNSAVGAYSTLA